MKKYLITIALIFSPLVHAVDYKTALTGKRLVAEGAYCSGISLKKNAGLSGEIGHITSCTVDLPARLKWLDENTFMLVEKDRPDETSPPRVFLYKIKGLHGNKVTLTEVWTGWNNYPDDEATYIIKP